MPNSRVILCIMDGWGVAPASPGNAITLAAPPNFLSLNQNFPSTTLEASGIAVGLPAQQDGNTETGHLNIGAGRIVYQDLARINMSIADGTFFHNEVLISTIEHAKTNNSALHLLGLIGSSGVHAYNDHLYALLMLAAHRSLKKVYVHLITDGRDSPPFDALNQIKMVQSKIDQYHVGQIVSLSGRYYAMDRDMHLERTQLAFDCLTTITAPNAPTVEAAIKSSYDAGLSDEFVKPVSIGADVAETRIKANDAVFFYNFRIDRPRQLTKMFIDSGIANLKLATMTRYHAHFEIPVAFADYLLVDTLGEIVSKYGLKQLHAAESEKERFVTYYFNGLFENPFWGEKDLIVPSPRVATYDLQPQMSTPQLIADFCNEFRTGQYSFGILNVACPDMVAHTGNIPKTVEAIKAADQGLGELIKLADETDSYLLMTGDHGNAEELLNRDTGAMDTEHSLFPVPLIIYKKGGVSGKLETGGVLADIAPTILNLLGIPRPSEMTGNNLLITS